MLKRVIVIVVVLFFGLGLWYVENRRSLNQSAGGKPRVEELVDSPMPLPSTSTPSAAAEKPSVQTPPPAEPARIVLNQPLFNYDIKLGETPCGDKIGTVEISSSDPSKELYWGFTGSKPIWLTFSAVEGKTPAPVDMTFNCIMSGAESDIDWSFTVVEKTKEGKWIDGYARIFKLKGDIIESPGK